MGFFAKRQTTGSNPFLDALKLFATIENWSDAKNKTNKLSISGESQQV